jgi:hypothetical protein
MPINNDLNKKMFIEEFKKRLNDKDTVESKNNKIGIHLSVYEFNAVLNEIIFEILYLGVVNYNNEKFLIIPENVYIYVEIANTF